MIVVIVGAVAIAAEKQQWWWSPSDRSSNSKGKGTDGFLGLWESHLVLLGDPSQKGKSHTASRQAKGQRKLPKPTRAQMYCENIHGVGVRERTEMLFIITVTVSFCRV